MAESSSNNPNPVFSGDEEGGIGVSIVTPVDWFEINIEPSDEELREVAAQLPEAVTFDASGEELVELLVQTREGSRQVGLSYAAAMVDSAEGRRVANLTVASVPVAEGLASAATMEADPTVIAEALRGDGSDKSRDASVVEIGGREAARIKFMLRSEAGKSSGDPHSLCVQYFVPVPGGSVIVLTFTTPILAQAEQFAELFDRIASTLELEVGAPAAGA